MAYPIWPSWPDPSTVTRSGSSAWIIGRTVASSPTARSPLQPPRVVAWVHWRNRATATPSSSQRAELPGGVRKEAGNVRRDMVRV